MQCVCTESITESCCHGNRASQELNTEQRGGLNSNRQHLHNINMLTCTVINTDHIHMWVTAAKKQPQKTRHWWEFFFFLNNSEVRSSSLASSASSSVASLARVQWYLETARAREALRQDCVFEDTEEEEEGSLWLRKALWCMCSPRCALHISTSPENFT